MTNKELTDKDRNYLMDLMLKRKWFIEDHAEGNEQITEELKTLNELITKI